MPGSWGIPTGQAGHADAIGTLNASDKTVARDGGGSQRGEDNGVAHLDQVQSQVCCKVLQVKSRQDYYQRKKNERVLTN
jgi:hypothetical protein